MSEMLEFKSAAGSKFGVVFELGKRIRLAPSLWMIRKELKKGNEVVALKRILEVPVSEAIIGRVLNPLGKAVGRVKKKSKLI